MAQVPVQQTPVQTPPPVPPQQPMEQQNFGQTQGYSPMQPRKSNKKLIGALVAIIIVVVVVVILLLLLIGGGDSRFVGRWEQVGSDGDIIWNFKSDGTLELITTIYGETTTTNMGTWEVRGNQLCGASTGYSTSCINFAFSNNGKTLTLYSPNGYDYDIVLNKI